MPRSRRSRASFPCPNCGEPVASGAQFCRECGSDASTGWSDDETGDVSGFSLEDDAYNDFLEREGLAAPGPTPPRKGMHSKARWFLIAAALALAGIALAALRHAF